MNILQISATDGTGGASRAARRLHDALRHSGQDSVMAVGSATTGGEGVAEITAMAGGGRSAPFLRAERAFPKLSRFTGELPLPFPSSRLLARTGAFQAADVIHLHNLHGSYFDQRVTSRWAGTVPVVWTLHDMWAFTGHCAYSYDCERWRSGCGSCPLYHGDRAGLDDIPQPPWDNSASQWRAKRSRYRRAPLTITAPSRWLTALAKESILDGHAETSFHHVPYGLDTDVYRPIPQAEARHLLGLAPDRPVLLFGAATLDQERKGLQYLLDAVRSTVLADRDLQLLTFGAAGNLDGSGVRLRSLGTITDDRLQALAYNAADIAVVPSLADNQPLIALEALACGVPVVASDVGGLPEIVRDMESGLLVPPGDSLSLALAAARLFDTPELASRLAEGARQVAITDHRLPDYARAYCEIYENEIAIQKERRATRHR